MKGSLTNVRQKSSLGRKERTSEQRFDKKKEKGKEKKRERMQGWLTKQGWKRRSESGGKKGRWMDEGTMDGWMGGGGAFCDSGRKKREGERGREEK